MQFILCFCPFLYFLIDFFQSIKQSFHITLIHINIRTRNIISAGVLIIRGRNHFTRGRGSQKTLNFFRKKNLTVPKIVAQCRKYPITYLNTYITYLNYSTRLSAPCLNTCLAYPNTLSRLHILPTRQPIRIKHYVTRVVSQSESSAAYQNRVPELSLPHRRTLRAWRSLLGSGLELACYSLS